MMYWFAVDPERPEVLDVGIRNGLWGVVEDARDEIEVLEPGDFILFFHRDGGFVLCEVESEPYTERVPVWSEVDFPHRVRISDPVETDRYAHLGEVHDCLLDPETGEPYSSKAKASVALEAAGGSFRPLSDEEIRCLFQRLGWTPPPDVAAPPAPEDEEVPEEEAPEEGEPTEAGEPAEAEDAREAPGEDEAPEEEEPPPEEAPGDGEEEPAAEEAAEPPEEDEPAVASPAAGGPEPAEAEPATAEPRERDGDEAGPAEADVEPAEADAPGPRVILAPAAGNEASRRRWKQTVEEGVPVDRLEGHLADDEIETLREASDAGRVRVWGTAPARDAGSRAQWSDSGPGDVILFSGGGEIFASARVLAKRRDPDLAEELWGRKEDGDTWEFLFFATEPARQGVPYEEFNEVAGYEPGYRIPRLNILETEQSLRILGAFPEFAVVPPEASAGEGGAPAAEERAEPEGPGDGPEAGAAEAAEDGAAPAAVAREEDGAPAEGVGAMDEDRLRSLLFGRRELGRCALCGRLLPVELLEVVYVKPLEACAPDELDDVGNDVFPGCRLGCAGLFRQGYLVVEDGVVRAGREGPVTDPVEERIEEIVGNRCEYWHSGSEPYFRWHAAESRDR